MIEEGKHAQQTAREHFSRGDLHRAWWGIYYAESCVGIGMRESRGAAELLKAIQSELGDIGDKALSQGQE